MSASSFWRFSSMSMCLFWWMKSLMFGRSATTQADSADLNTFMSVASYLSNTEPSVSCKSVSLPDHVVAPSEHVVCRVGETRDRTGGGRGSVATNLRGKTNPNHSSISPWRNRYSFMVLFVGHRSRFSHYTYIHPPNPNIKT